MPFDTIRHPVASFAGTLDNRLFWGVVRRPLGHLCQPSGADCRDDGTDTLQNQRLLLTGAGADAAHIDQDIIAGIVFQRPGLNGVLDVVRAGDVLVVNALDRLGRDTLGLPELINRLATTGVDL